MPARTWGMTRPKTVSVALVIEVTYDAASERGLEIDGLEGVAKEDALRDEIERAITDNIEVLSLSTPPRWRSFSMPDSSPTWDVPDMDQ